MCWRYTTRRTHGRSESWRRQLAETAALLFPQSFPHFDHLRSHFRDELLISCLRGFGFRRRKNRIAKLHAQRRELLERFSAGPCVVKPVNRDGNDGHLHVNRKNGGSLLELFRGAVN